MTKRLVLGVFLAVVVGVGSFFVAYRLWPDGGRTEAQPDIMAERDRLMQEEAAKPRFEGVVNGIRLYSLASGADVQRKDTCSDAKPEEAEELTMSDVVGTPMEIVPTYLPPGAEEVAPMEPPVACKGIVVSVQRWWTMRGKGDFFITRRQGEQAMQIDTSADRVSTATVGGKPAVVVAPLAPDGFGPSVVIVAEDFGLTYVVGLDLPLEETMKIAEGLK
ncbi:MAG: hypothetical protein MUP14_01490 [Dehalococcoidia bacterium]|nr:hypothetical protein [Dehalococcoidia bacterium]